MIKRIKIVIGILLICLIAYNSVYFEALDEKKLSEIKEDFSPKTFAQELMQTQINNVPALEASAYFAQLDSNFNSFTKEHGKTLGVSNYRYFMLEGKGKVLAIEDENVRLDIEGLDSQSILLATAALGFGLGPASHVDDLVTGGVKAGYHNAIKSLRSELPFRKWKRCL